MDFPLILAELRTKRKLSQQELADLLKERITGDIKRNTISNYENGKSAPDFETLLELGHILQTDMNELLGFIPENSDAVASFVYEGELRYASEEFLKPFEKKVDGIKKLLIEGKATEKELIRHLSTSLKMNEDLIRKVKELYEKYNKAYNIIKRELAPK